MALPAGITTFTLSFGPYTDAQGVVTVEAPATARLFPVDPATGARIKLTHLASGQVIVPSNVRVHVNGETGMATVGPLPHTDQAGLSMVGFAYRVEWDIASSKPSPGDKTFAVPAAVGSTADFDLLAVSDTPGVLVPVVVGATGAPGIADDASMTAIAANPESAFSVAQRAALESAIAAEPTVSAAVAARLASEQLVNGQIVTSIPAHPEDGVYFYAPTLAGTRHETGFEEYTAGARPTGWSAPWVDATSWTTLDSSGKRLRYGPETTGARRVLTWDAVNSDPDHADFDIVSRMRHGNLIATVTQAVAGRVSGAAASENGYLAAIRPGPPHEFRIFKYVAGVSTVLGAITVPFTITSTTEYYVRFRGRGSALSAKTWLFGDPEPSTWHIERTDTALTAGAVGVFSSATTSTYDWLDFTVATGGRQGRAWVA